MTSPKVPGSLSLPGSRPLVTDDRESFREARDAGLKVRQERRLENATYTAAEVKVLTAQAGEFGYRLGRAEMAEEITAAIEQRRKSDTFGPMAKVILGLAAGIAREIGSKPSPDATSGRTDPEGCQSTHPMASHIPCVKPPGHGGDHVSKNGRNWRPRDTTGDPT